MGDLAGGDFSSAAVDVSDDASVVVGFANTASGQEAFVWTSSGGMQRLLDVLVMSENRSFKAPAESPGPAGAPTTRR
ncbi:MAG: hypothetical protein JNK40_05440 [Chromatiales bacterium]|nr:hypothetical protein [Chromatiales bacterium]